MHLRFRRLLTFGFLILATQLNATEVWNGPAFAADPAALRQAAYAVKPDKDAHATVLLNEWYARDYKGVLDYAATLPASDVRKGLTLAAMAVQQGSDAALKKSFEITTDDQGRSNALRNSGAVLIRVRKYSEGAAMDPAR